MSLSTIRLSPNMSYQDLISSLNENFSLLENSNKTLIVKDSDGVQRIILGALPDGTYGMIISKSGVNVVSLFNS